MAMRLLSTNGTWTTGTWNRVEAASMDWDFGNGTYDKLSTTPRTVAVTFANAGNQVGIALPLLASFTTYTDDIVIKLQEYVGSTWTTRTTDAFAVATVITNPGAGHFYYFALTTYAVSVAASTWRYSVERSGTSGALSWVRSATASDWGYAVTLDANADKPSNGDSIIVAQGCTYTVDCDQSYAYDNTTNYRCFWGCDSAVYAWENPPVASYTVTAGGRIWVSSTGGQFSIGTALSPIPYAQQAVIDFSHASVSFYFETSNRQFSGTTYVTSRCYVYGEEAANIHSRIAADANATQPVLVLEDNMSAAWNATDEVAIYGQLATSTVGANALRVISSVVGTTLTLTADLTWATVKGGVVINRQRGREMGVRIIHSASPRVAFAISSSMNICIVGVHTSYCGIGNFELQSRTVSNLWRSIFMEAPVTSTRFDPRLYIGEYACVRNPSVRDTINKIYLYSGTTSYTPLINLDSVGVSAAGSYKDVSEVFSMGGDQANLILMAPGTVECTFDAIVIQGVYYRSTQATFLLRGVGHTVSDVVITSLGIGMWQSGAYACTLSGVEINAATYGLMLGNGVNNTYTDCNWGDKLASVTKDIGIEASTYVGAVMNNNAVGTSGVDDFTITLVGSMLQIDSYNETANDHRTYQPYGKTISTGDGLTDTTVHTAGTGKFALRFEPTSSTDNLDWDFTIPTGNIQGLTMTVSVWCKIASATYYAGTHQLPRLTIDYDDGTEGYCQAAEITDWQLMSVTFIPTTTYGQITVTLSARTDATTTSAYVYWDDFNVAYPANTVLDLGGLDNWSNALPVVPPIAIPLSANTVALAVFQQLTATSYGTGTFGEFLKTLTPSERMKFIVDGEIPIY